MLIPVVFEIPRDRRKPNCWIQDSQIVRLIPLYGYRNKQSTETDDLFYTCSPNHEDAEVVGYEILYSDGTIFFGVKAVIEKELGLITSKQIGFNRPNMQDDSGANS